jgi:hypothetical protein
MSNLFNKAIQTNQKHAWCCGVKAKTKQHHFWNGDLIFPCLITEIRNIRGEERFICRGPDIQPGWRSACRTKWIGQGVGWKSGSGKI